MLTRQDCLDALRALIDRADADGFGAAQNLILRYALEREGPERRARAIDELLGDIGGDRAAAGSPAQQAFRTALLAMLERTKLTVGQGSRETRD